MTDLEQRIAAALEAATIMPDYAAGDDRFDHYVDPEKFIAAIATPAPEEAPE